MADPPTEDPFDGWVLDDDFVKGAFRTEHSADERIERMQRLDADLRRMPGETSGRPRRARSGGGRFARLRARVPRWWWVVLLLVIAVVAVEVYQDREQPGERSGSALVDEVFVVNGTVTDRPTVPADLSAVPVGVAPTPPEGGGAYEFVMTQAASDEPVAFDPCRPVMVVVNALAAPAGSEGLVQRAVAEVAAATGLQFQIEGPTTEGASSSRPPVQVARYGDRWAPVLISWTDPATIDALEGATVGVGGSQAISVATQGSVYVTGMVALDGPQLTEILDGEGGRAIVQGVIAHELGHVVGLDHVDDPGELMAPETDGSTTTFGPGDRTGLARLGSGACFPDL